MIKVNSSQFNYTYNDETRFPYSIGTLVAYVKTKKNLEENFQFEKTFVFREKIDDYVKRCKDSDILLCSCYVWNWEITTFLAKEVKRINPKCLIIFGGPEVPDLTGDFFEKHPFVDLIVHGEGEYILANIFEEFLNKKDFSKIKGLETKDYRTEPEPRINDLDSLPSPYLTNTVWDLAEKVDGIRWICPWETNRGCPYLCTFCDWGSLTATRMTKWPEEMLFKEVEWFADNKIVYIDCCDANFGIFQDRDLRIAKKLKEVALKKSFPERVRPAWAKFSSDKIIPIAKELQKGGILRAVTLALQSLDENTLDIIKRANIKFDKFTDLTAEFRTNSIPTYTELIMGMPGETLESWKKGLGVLISDSKIGTIYIYNCAVFPNAPMNEPAYLNHYKIKTINSPIFLAHVSNEDNQIQEYEDIVISTSSFTKEDLKEMFVYSWMILAFHHLGVLEYIATFYNRKYNLPLIKFYETLLEFAKTEKSVFSEEYEKVVKYRNDGYDGKGWDQFDSDLGDINWPIEEATWLRVTANGDKLANAINDLLVLLERKENFHTDQEILKDLIRFQMFLLTMKEDSRDLKTEKFWFNWKDFFVNDKKLEKTETSYYYKNQIVEDDYIQWLIKTIWYGRIATKYKLRPERLVQQKSELAKLVTN